VLALSLFLIWSQSLGRRGLLHAGEERGQVLWCMYVCMPIIYLLYVCMYVLCQQVSRGSGQPVAEHHQLHECAAEADRVILSGRVLALCVQARQQPATHRHRQVEGCNCLLYVV
jgi:hypothetical protein